MALKTSLAGRVRNTSLPKSHALLPVLEAVVNGIQAVDDRYGEGEAGGAVEVSIVRSAQGELDIDFGGPGRVPLPPIVGFIIKDNGIGFTPVNMSSFETLDSDHKVSRGGRGVGRLLWLKAFDRVEVESSYADEDATQQGVHFQFSIEREVEQLPPLEDLGETGTRVHLIGFKDSYQKNAPKGADAIAREIFEHCIWYFLREGGGPTVTVKDDEGVITLNDMIEEFVDDEMPITTMKLSGEEFSMVNLRLKSAMGNAAPSLYWCAANRVVAVEKFGSRVPGLHGKLKDGDSSEFTYACYLSSPYLDRHVRSDRTAFDLSDRSAGDSLIEELSKHDIREAVAEEVERILAEPLAEARELGKERVHTFVSKVAPRYRIVAARLEEMGVSVDPAIGNQELELLLHRNLRKMEEETIAEGQAVFAEEGSIPLDEYNERLEKYIDKVTAINQSDLAGYVARRRVILDVLAKRIRLTDDGKYSREDAVHALLFPMQEDSDSVAEEASNLWIIDESLAFHDYLASDKTLKSMPVTGAEDTKEPDILATQLVDQPILAADGETLPLASIVVVEIKRPMRNDASEDKNPIEQCLNYVQRVRQGGVKTYRGRPIPDSSEIPAFCYVIADLTPRMQERCAVANLAVTHDRLGYFGYNQTYKAYIEVISFDRLVNAANERNHAFFQKLGLPLT